MRHRWARSWWQTLRHLAWCERCEKCGAVRKRDRRSWLYLWPALFGKPGGWLRKAIWCGEHMQPAKAGDRQRELFEGEVKA